MIYPDPDSPFNPQTRMAEVLQRAVAHYHGIPDEEVTHRMVNDFMAPSCLAEGRSLDA